MPALASLEEIGHRQPEYREWAPHAALADRVVCTWLDPSRATRQPVLPDACIDLVWDGHWLTVAGPDTRAVEIEPRDTFVGVRFRPGAAPGFLGVPAVDLLDARVPLNDLWGGVANDLADRLRGAHPTAAIALLEHALLDRADAAREPDRLIAALLDELTERNPCVDSSDPIDDIPEAAVRTAASSLGVSPRTLRRRSTDALGYGPKTLDRVLRFRRAVRLLRQPHSIADAAHLAGYADQAHLTNECRRLANTTPGSLAATSSRTLSANGYN